MVLETLTSIVRKALSPNSSMAKVNNKKAAAAAAAVAAAAGAAAVATTKASKKRGAASVAENRPKRARNNPADAAVYDPEDFTMKESEGIKMIKGRGTKLGSFPSVKASIESSKRTVDEITFAHQFLFGKKGKVSKKDMKANLLEFSGYLKPIPSGKNRTDKEVDKQEELVETKMSKKVYALNKAQIVDLCNFFNLTMVTTKDEPKMDKDTCIDRLLDFLGGPHKDWLISEEGTKKTKAVAAAPKKKPTKKAAAAPPKNTTKTDYGKIKDATGKGTMPTEEVLRAWVRAYVACFNLDKATTKHAIITCSEKFGVDMSKKKQHIKQLLAEEL